MSDYDHPLFYSLYKQAAAPTASGVTPSTTGQSAATTPPTPDEQKQDPTLTQDYADSDKAEKINGALEDFGKNWNTGVDQIATNWLADQTDKLIPGAGKWARENPTIAKALTFLGIPSIAALGIWAIGNAFDKSKKGPSFWSYLLPMLGVGGATWWATSNITPRKWVLGDLANPQQKPPKQSTT